MGWYQDNWPGSPAQRQRVLVSRGIIAYSVVVGTAIFFLAPLTRRIRKELEDAGQLYSSEWIEKLHESRRLDHRQVFGTKPTVQQLLDAKQVDEKRNRGDLVGPDLSDQEIRRPNV